MKSGLQATFRLGRDSRSMPDEVPSSADPPGPPVGPPGPPSGPPGSPAGPICPAAPTRLAGPDRGHAQSRRWLIVGSIVVAGLLAGASVALAGTDSTPAAPVHATSTSAPAP